MALLCAALAWQTRQKEDGDMLTESDQESEEEGDDPVINAGNNETQRSFDDFRYVESKDLGSAARLKHGREGRAPVRLEYEKITGSVGEVSARKHTKQHLLDDDDDDVFETPKKKRTKNLGNVAPLSGRKGSANGDFGKNIHLATGVAATPDTLSNVTEKYHSTVKSAKDSKSSTEESPPIAINSSKRMKKRANIKRKRPRRVYFCSRTHSQLDQVVAELRKCVEACPSVSAVRIGEDGKAFRMSLLASRKSTCINKTACNDPKGVDDACKRLLKNNACMYYRRAKYAPTKMPPVWDVEEAVRVGKENGTCVYQTTRDALITADIVLGPYNYLVDPSVREIMGIKLKDAVVIFDEAHNLEDMAREAASAKLSLRALSNAADEMQRLGSKCPSLASAYLSLGRVIVGVQEFLEEKEATLPLETYETAHKVFNGTEALGLMQSRAGVTCDSLGKLKEALRTVANEEATDSPNIRDLEEHGGNALSSGALQLTSSLVKVLGFLLTEGMENVEHYKMVVLRERAPWQPADTTQGSRRGGRRSRGRSGNGSGVFNGYGVGGSMETYLCFWCLSASVCFSEIDKQVHSTVLTSGTLSPLNSFAGELGIHFPHKLEAPHVINVAKQCLVTSVGLSGGVPLDARYDNRNALGYQDALGEAILQYARIVPGGMLIFFPSYGLLDKTYNRWKATGFLNALEVTKAVFLEPKGRGKISEVLTKFYKAVKGSRKNHSEDGDFEVIPQKRPPNSQRGALMFAVARGKVSEGIDFSDDAARMCVIVGIPYPSAGDLQRANGSLHQAPEIYGLDSLVITIDAIQTIGMPEVKLKKEYQDQRRRLNPHLVDGRAWYNLQAFRAVNQAIGRCIRHRNDFGAIVLCDPRYSSQATATCNLSKWVRSSIKHARSVEGSLPLVKGFFQSHLAQQHSIGTEPKLLAKPSVDLLNEGRCKSTDGDDGGSTSLSGGGRKDARVKVFGESPADVRVNNSNMSARKKRGMAAGPKPGLDIRIALGLTTIPTPKENAVCPSSAVIPAALVPGQRNKGFYCRSSECTGGALVSEPVSDHPAPSRPRWVTVQEGHLCRMAAAAVAGDASLALTVTGTNSRHVHILLEAPQDWVMGKHVSEGDGRWVAGDGVVYSPLFCSCAGCRRVQVGEKAVGAGQGGFQLVGRTWFFTSRVEAEGLDSGSPVELIVPAQVSKRETTTFRHLTDH